MKTRRSTPARRRGRLLACVLLPLLAACATTAPLPRVGEAVEPPALCRALFERLDAAVARAGVGDAGADRLDGFPWLRVDRPLASFRFETSTEARLAAWLQRLAALDAEGRSHELNNLPAGERARLVAEWRAAAAGSALPADLAAAQADCRERLNARLAADPAATERLVAAAWPRDEYRDWQRVVGLYPLTRLVVLPQVATLQDTRRAAIRAAPESGPRWRRYAVPSPPAPAPVLPAVLPRDALGIPRPTPAQRAALFSAHAPLWAVETESDSDRPGAVVRAADRPLVDSGRPVEYRHWSWTRFRGEVLVQLSYALWFPERPADGALDLYAGHLDGLIWRVTLRGDGTPLAYESIHPCGCYYTLFPAPGWRVRAGGGEPVLAPLSAPRPAAGERVRVRLEARTHYLAGVDTAGARGARPLAPLPLDALRSLPLPEGGRRSAFAPDGLIPSSRRLERFLLWPLGVPSPGAMRQWGTHAIAFVGKRHFDDPDLLDRLLERDDADAD
ncbi:MAG: hypothetical protein R3225_09635 [Halofilum sp. (in: g-proteobacteria)]|nr:hypothetical protein [Halofilum sp. (in: g-proteobacteria)]